MPSPLMPPSLTLSETHSQIATAVAIGALLVALIGLALALARRNREISVGPIFALAAGLLILLYALGALVDIGAALLAEGPRSPYASFVERLTLGRIDVLAPLLPLRARPLLAAPIHCAAALGLYLLLVNLCWWFGRGAKLDPDGRHRAWRRIFDLCGYNGLRTVEDRFRAWATALVGFAPLLLFGGFWELFHRDPAKPPLAPFLFGVCLATTFGAIVNLLASRAPKKQRADKPAADETAAAPADPARWIEALQRRGFEVAATAARCLPPIEPVHGDAGAHGDTELARELIRELTGAEGLWPHQVEALERLLERQQDVLMATPARSGKTTVARLLAGPIAVDRGRNVLVLARDPHTAREACERHAARLARTTWGVNLRCTAAGPELTRLLAQRRAPVLCYADPDALDGMLGAVAEQRYFLEHLGLVVFEDIERYSGVRAAHLHFIARRLWSALGTLRARPRVFATLGLQAPDFERYAETLLGVDLQLIASDGGPGAPVELHPASGPSDATLPAAALAAAEATGLGLPAALVGFAGVTRSELDRAAALVTRTHGEVEPARPDAAQVSVAELGGPQLARIGTVLRHLGARRPARDAVHRQILLPRPDPLSRFLHASIERTLELARRGRVLIADSHNEAIARRHLLRTLASGPARLDWAERVFGAATVAALERAGALAWESGHALEGEPPQLRPVRWLSLERPPQAPAGHVDTVSTDPVVIVDRATGAVLRRLDPGRAALVAHPGAVLRYRGRRFVVPLDVASHEAGAEIRVELCEPPVSSVRVRRLALELLAPGAALLRPLSLGGAAVDGGLLPVSVREEVFGVRRHGPDGRLISMRTFEPCHARFRSEARVLLLGALTTPAALHALVHLLRGAIETRVDCGEQGLHVAHTDDLAGRGPALLLLDTYEGGVGYARAADLGALGDCLGLLDELLSRSCCDGAGCPRCVRTQDCHESEPDQAQLDRAGAHSLVRRLLGR